MNTIYQFTEEVAEQIKDYLPEEYKDMESQIDRMPKINAGYQDAVRLQRKGNIGLARMSLEPYFDAYKRGVPINEIMEHIADRAVIYLEPEDKGFIGKMKNFENVRDLLSPILLNTRSNYQILQDMPHMRIEDLSVICQIELPEQDGGWSMKVRHEHLRQWGIGKEQLFKQLLENMQKPGVYILQEVKDCIKDILEERDSQVNLLDAIDSCEKSPEGGEIYALSNAKRTYGAAAMICPSVMEKINQLFPDGYYILPSSLHECLIVPKPCVISLERLRDMVREINVTELQNNEILSDNVYEYDRESKRIRQAPKTYEKEKGMER